MTVCSGIFFCNGRFEYVAVLLFLVGSGMLMYGWKRWSKRTLLYLGVITAALIVLCIILAFRDERLFNEAMRAAYLVT